MVANQEVDPRRDGGMKSMTHVDLLRESIMPNTDCRGKTMLRPSSIMDRYWLNMMMMMMTCRLVSG